MNWEAISALGQIIGAIAVVVSVIYLALQVRSNARQTRLASMRSMSDAFNQFLQGLAGNPQIMYFVNDGGVYRTVNSSGLAGGTQYSYRVRATNAAGDSSYSNTAAVATPYSIWSSSVAPGTVTECGESATIAVTPCATSASARAAAPARPEPL